MKMQRNRLEATLPLGALGYADQAVLLRLLLLLNGVFLLSALCFLLLFWTEESREFSALDRISYNFHMIRYDVQDFFRGEPELAELASYSSRQDLPGVHPEVFQEYDAHVKAAAYRFQIDPDLIRAVIVVESNYNADAVSHRGAGGLMQLMPATAQELGVKDRFNPRENIFGGVAYLQQLLQEFGGNETLALAAYNAGPGAVRRYDGVPPYRETQKYVQKVQRVHTLFQKM